MEKQDTIRIRWQMPRGELGVDSDPQNPLNVSLAKLFSEKSDLDFNLPKRSKGSPKTLELGEDRCLWFGFIVQSPALLKNLYRETIATFKSPGCDSERRLSEFHKARDGMEFLLMSINGDIDTLKESVDSFLHFTFIVGITGFNPYLGGNIALPHGGPYVESFQTGAVQLPSKTFMVNMSEDVAVKIICNVVPGKLAMPYSVTGQEANNAN
jgi:hypothetical protein